MHICRFAIRLKSTTFNESFFFIDTEAQKSILSQTSLKFNESSAFGL